MKRNKLNYSYYESKNLKNNDKDKNQTKIIKRSEKRHKTEMGKIPKNFQFLINKSKLKFEDEKDNIKEDKKDDNKGDKISNHITVNNSYNHNTNNFRKHKSSCILPNLCEYYLNKEHIEILKNKDDNKKDTHQHPSFKKSKTQLVQNKLDINTYRHAPNFPKYERRMSDKFIKNKEQTPKKIEEFQKKEEPKISKENNKDMPIISITKSRRKSIGSGIRHYTKKESQLKKEFKKITYVKASRATSEPGMEDGHKKTNQDSYIYEKNINGVVNFNIFGVLDGHGDFGHLASNFVKGYILNRIKNHPSIKYLNDTKKIYKVLTNREYHIITNIFLDADIQIKKEKFNCEMSGTTCILVFQLDEHLICANTGDSRAILIYDESPNNNLTQTKVFPLSIDAKPENPGEKERIIASGGEVEKMVDEDNIEVGPYRIWIKGEQYPGIAMSRSIGDMDAKTVGVIPNPQFIEYTLNSKSKYMLVCSDGIFEFISNEEVMNTANTFYLKNDVFGLCKTLTEKSTELWLKDDNYVDDITVVAVFF